MNTKRTFLIVGGVLVLIVGAFLVYYFFVYRPAIPQNAVDIAIPEDQPINLTQEDVERGVTREDVHEEIRQQLNITAEDAVTVKKILEKPVLGATLSRDEDRVLFYDVENEQLRSVNLEGDDEQQVSGGTFSQVTRVVWAPTKDAVILDFQQGATVRSSVFTLEDEKLTELDPRISSAVFSQDGTRIFYLFSDKSAGVERLTVALRDGSNIQGLKNYRSGEIQLQWPAEDLLSYGGVASGYTPSSFFTMDARGENNRTLLADRYAADLHFSPDGSRVVFSQAPRKPHTASLLLMDADGRNVVDTQLNTLARKCTWSTTGFTVVCGVPSTLREGAILPEDYENRRVVTRDDLYRINTRTGEAQKIVDHAQFTLGYDLQDPFMTEDQQKVFFTRRNDGNLYAYDIP